MSVYIDSGLSLLASMWSGAYGKYRVVVDTESSASWWSEDIRVVHLGGRMPSTIKGVKGKLCSRLVLEGLLIHELGHVRFTTDVRDQEKLKKASEREKKGKHPGVRSVRDLLPCPWDIINILEDRRIEARQMAEFGDREIKTVWETYTQEIQHNKPENIIFSNRRYKAKFNVYNALITFSLLRAKTVNFGPGYEAGIRRLGYTDKQLLEFREDVHEATDAAIAANDTHAVMKISTTLYEKYKELFDFFDGYTPMPEIKDEEEESSPVAPTVDQQSEYTQQEQTGEITQGEGEEDSNEEILEDLQGIFEEGEAEPNKDSTEGMDMQVPDDDPNAKKQETGLLSPERGYRDSVGKTEVPEDVKEVIRDDKFNESKKKTQGDKGGSSDSSENGGDGIGSGSNEGKSDKNWSSRPVFEWDEALIRKESAIIRRYLTVGTKTTMEHGIAGKEVNARKLSVPTLRVFKHKIPKQQGPKVPLIVVLDNSGSMNGFPQVCGAHVARILHESGVFPDMITLICSDAGVIPIRDPKKLQYNSTDGDESFQNLMADNVLPYLANKIVLFLTDACTYGPSADAIHKLARKTKVIGGYVGDHGNSDEVIKAGQELFPAFIVSDSTEGIGLKLARFINKANNRKSLYQYK